MKIGRAHERADDRHRSAMTTRATSEACIPPTLYHSSSGGQPVDHQHQRDYQQDVNQIAAEREGDEPEQPEDDENDDDDPK